MKKEVFLQILGKIIDILINFLKKEGKKVLRKGINNSISKRSTLRILELLFRSYTHRNGIV